MMKLPLVDLAANLAPLRAEIDGRIGAVLAKGDFILGGAVQAFESEFARFCGAAHCVGVANGTDAIHLALRAAGVGHGDEVLIPANTFIATAVGVTMAGAKPVVVDCEADTFLMDPSKIERAITPRTKAIVPVHLFGRCMDLEPVLAIAAMRRLTVIEDAAQAHGAGHHGMRAGTRGAMGCFSFYPGKNL